MSTTSDSIDASASRRKGMALVLFAGASWGVISLFLRRLASLGFTPMEIAAARSILACLILLCIVACVEPKALRLRLKDAWCMFGCGVVSISFFNLNYFYTIQHTTVNIAVTLLYTSPVFVAILSRIFLKEPFGKRKLAALVSVTIGCALVSGMFNSNALRTLTPQVFLMGLASGFFYSLFSIFGRFAQDRGYSSLAITLWAFIFSAIVFTFFMDWQHVAHCVSQSPSSLFFAVGLALVSTILPYCAYTEGLKHLPASLAAIVATSEPIVGTLVGLLVFHEALSWDAILGMFLVLGAMFIG